jgi:hypothetical protein
MGFLRVLMQLLRPWAYLRIHAQGKIVFDWIVPAVMATIAAAMLALAGREVSVFGDNGVISKMTGFVQNLPGFFIAALAAVATFNRDDLDSLLPAPTPTMVVLNRGLPVPLELTRRRFLCALFAFLTAQSLAVTCMGIFAVSFSSWVVQSLQANVVPFCKIACGFLYLLLLAQLLSVTCLGLYYLGDRLHTPD